VYGKGQNTQTGEIMRLHIPYKAALLKEDSCGHSRRQNIPQGVENTDRHKRRGTGGKNTV